MITNFEDITHELNEYEMSLVAIVVLGFGKYTIDNPIKSADAVKSMNAKGYKMTGARLRKICNYIRCNSLLPLIGTSSGYYVSDDVEVIQKQILSLRERARSINNCADGLQKLIS